MPRIEWTLLEGNQAETVIANLLFHEYPRAIRMRPSQGDGGIDLLIPRESSQDGVDVYQIKRFAANLTSSQKRQVERSFRRLLIAVARGKVQAADWYVVMPLDPTPENLEWFQGMPEEIVADLLADSEVDLAAEEQQRLNEWRDSPGRKIEWRGLILCDGLAAKYGFVADYFLHGGSERLSATVDALAQLISVDRETRSAEGVAVLEPAELEDHLARLRRVLDTDPHFRYFFRTDPVRPILGAEDGLIAAVQRPLQDGSWLTFTIYGRFDESVNEREIPIAIDFDTTETPPDALREWAKYGRPMIGTAAIEVGLPGGLGVSSDHAAVTIMPSEGATYALRLRTVAPDGQTVGTISLEMVSVFGLDQTGSWVHGRDQSGLLEVEALIDGDKLGASFRLTFDDPTGHEVVAALPAVEFLSGLVAPNKLEVAEKHGPFRTVQEVPALEAPVSTAAVRYLRATALLQDRTSTPILVPAAEQMTADSVREVLLAAALVQGRTVVATWESSTMTADSVPLYGHNQIEFVDELSATVGDQTIPIGLVKTTLLSTNLTRQQDDSYTVEPNLNNMAHRVLLKDEEAAEWTK